MNFQLEEQNKQQQTHKLEDRWQNNSYKINTLIKIMADCEYILKSKQNSTLNFNAEPM